jgi:hypothetical protein
MYLGGAVPMMMMMFYRPLTKAAKDRHSMDNLEMLELKLKKQESRMGTFERGELARCPLYCAKWPLSLQSTA